MRRPGIADRFFDSAWAKAAALVLAVTLAVVSGCAAVEAKLCGVHPTYGRVCAYWSGGKLVIEAEVSIPEESAGEVLEWLKKN